jgi:hypothetical protein
MAEQKANNPSCSVLAPRAEFAVQRAEEGIRQLRRTGNADCIGRIHYELAKAAEAQSVCMTGLTEDDEMEI